MKYLIKLLTIAVVLMASLSFNGCSNNSESGSDVSAVLIVDCSEVIQNLDSVDYGISKEKYDILPDEGTIIKRNVAVDDGDTAHAILIKELMKDKLHFEEKDGYIKGISNIYEGDCGEFSGWMFYINGELAAMGADETVVEDGDEVMFKYVVDYMKLFE